MYLVILTLSLTLNFDINLRLSQTVPTCWPTFEPTLLVNMLANMLLRFAIDTNMLGKKKDVGKCWPTFIKFLINVGQHCQPNSHVGTFCYGQQHVGQHFRFRAPFRMFLFEFRTSLITKTKINISNQNDWQ